MLQNILLLKNCKLLSLYKEDIFVFGNVSSRNEYPTLRVPGNVTEPPENCGTKKLFPVSLPSSKGGSKSTKLACSHRDLSVVSKNNKTKDHGWRQNKDYVGGGTC